MRTPTALLAVFALLGLFTFLPATASARVISLDTRELKSQRIEFGLSKRQDRAEEEVSQTSTRPRPNTTGVSENEKEQSLKETRKTETKTEKKKEEETKTKDTTVKPMVTADVLAVEDGMSFFFFLLFLV